MNKHNFSGFTLIEILIAIVVFSIVITLLFSSFRAFMVTSNRVKDELFTAENISIVSHRIRQDVQSAFLLQQPRYRTPEFSADPDPYRMLGEQETVGQYTVSKLVFASLAHADISSVSRPAVAKIAYYLKEDDKGTFDLYRADFSPPYPDDNTSCTDPVLCRGISGFEITYFDENGDDTTSWDSDAAEYNYTYPRSINFGFTFKNGENLTKFVVSVEMQAGRSSIE